MDVHADDLIAALKLQREVQATEAALMAAACEGLKRRVAELEAALEQAKPPRGDAGDGQDA